MCCYTCAAILQAGQVLFSMAHINISNAQRSPLYIYREYIYTVAALQRVAEEQPPAAENSHPQQAATSSESWQLSTTLAAINSRRLLLTTVAARRQLLLLTSSKGSQLSTTIAGRGGEAATRSKQRRAARVGFSPAPTPSPPRSCRICAAVRAQEEPRSSGGLGRVGPVGLVASSSLSRCFHGTPPISSSVRVCEECSSV